MQEQHACSACMYSTGPCKSICMHAYKKGMHACILVYTHTHMRRCTDAQSHLIVADSKDILKCLCSLTKVWARVRSFGCEEGISHWGHTLSTRAHLLAHGVIRGSPRASLALENASVVGDGPCEPCSTAVAAAVAFIHNGDAHILNQCITVPYGSGVCEKNGRCGDEHYHTPPPLPPALILAFDVRRKVLCRNGCFFRRPTNLNNHTLYKQGLLVRIHCKILEASRRLSY